MPSEPANGHILAKAGHWGKGVTRRQIRLVGRDGQVEAWLGDHNHAMHLMLHHDGKQVTGLDPHFHRATLTHCAGAADPLAEVVGMPIGITTQDFFAGGRARRNCTHMLDLAWLALRHACRPHGERLYDIAIPDALTGRQTGELHRDGVLVLSWDVEGQRIVAPPAFAGQSPFRGLVGWVMGNSALSEDEREAALVLHKGFFMMGSREYVLPTGPLSQAEREIVSGLCYGFAEQRVADAVRVDDVFHDFSDRPDELLSFGFAEDRGC